MYLFPVVTIKLRGRGRDQEEDGNMDEHFSFGIIMIFVGMVTTITILTQNEKAKVSSGLAIPLIIGIIVPAVILSSKKKLRAHGIKRFRSLVMSHCHVRCENSVSPSC